MINSKKINGNKWLRNLDKEEIKKDNGKSIKIENHLEKKKKFKAITIKCMKKTY